MILWGSFYTNVVIMKALSPIWLTKPETARRVMQRIRTVFQWAKASGHRSGDNPVDGVSKVLPKQTAVGSHHAALPYDRVPQFIKDLRYFGNRQFALGRNPIQKASPKRPHREPDSVTADRTLGLRGS